MIVDMRTGEIRTLPDFSESLERTIAFANDLVRRGTPPSGLYDVALEYLFGFCSPDRNRSPLKLRLPKKFDFTFDPL